MPSRACFAPKAKSVCPCRRPSHHRQNKQRPLMLSGNSGSLPLRKLRIERAQVTSASRGRPGLAVTPRLPPLRNLEKMGAEESAANGSDGSNISGRVERLWVSRQKKRLREWAV